MGNSTKNRPDKDDKTTKVIINAREFEINDKKLDFEQVVRLAFNEYDQDERIVYTVTYSKGKHNKKGILVAGDEVPIKEGMVFNVTKTTRS